MRLALVCFYCLCVFVYVLYFIATMSFAGYFLPVLCCMLSMLISDSRFDLVWFRLSCDHGWIRSGSVNVRKQQQQQQQHIIFLKTLRPSLWRGFHQYTSVTSYYSTEVSLKCHGRRARLSLRAMVLSPSKKNSGLVNPRWRMYIDFFKKGSINSRKEWTAFSMK